MIQNKEIYEENFTFIVFYKEEVIDRSTPVNNSLLTGVLRMGGGVGLGVLVQ